MNRKPLIFSLDGYSFGDLDDENLTPENENYGAQSQNSQNYDIQTMTSQNSQTGSNIVETVTNVADNSVNTTLDKAGTILSSPDVQKFLQDQGLTPYLKDVTKDRVKSVLSLFGLWWMTQKLKSKPAMIAIAALGVYIYTTNSDKLTEKISDKVTTA